MGWKVRSKREYWKCLFEIVRRCPHTPAKLWLGFNIMLSANHFLIYSREVAQQLAPECRSIEAKEAIAPRSGYSGSAAVKLAARA